MPPKNPLPNRRSVLKGIAGVSVPILGGAGYSVARQRNSTGSDAPAVEWGRRYGGKDREYEFTKTFEQGAIVQTSDGGYAICAEGHKITKTGDSDEFMAVIDLDTAGRYQSHSFLKDDHENSWQTSSDLLQTDDGGFVIAGSRRAPVAQVGKIDANGNQVWFTEIPSKDPESVYEGDRKAEVKSVVPAVDGGSVVGFTGTKNYPRVVKLDTGGSIVWDKRYDGGDAIGLGALTRTADGYLFGGADTVVKLDATGNKQWTKPLSGMSITDIIPTEDGGFAITADTNAENNNFNIWKFDANRSQEWHKEYDGPFEGDDFVYSVIQTPDGGYTLAGEMEEAYSGDRVAAVVRTDSDGTELWEKLIKQDADQYESDVWAPAAASIIQTRDGGFAVTAITSDTPGAAKLLPAGDTEQTATSTETPGDTPTDTPSDASTDTETPGDETATADSGDETPTPTETKTTGEGGDDTDCDI